MLVGDNGLISRLIQAREDSIIAQEKEQISLAWATLFLEKTTEDIEFAEKFEEELNKSEDDTHVEYVVEDEYNYYKVTFEKTKHTYAVDSVGNIEMLNYVADEEIPDEDAIIVTLNAEGGTIPKSSSKKWKGSGQTAEKTLNNISTYGELPTPTKSDYSFLGWNATLIPSEYQEIEYIKFNGNEYIDTGIIPSNHKTEIRFDFETYATEALFGTNQGFGYYSFISYSNKYDYGLNGSELYRGTWTTGIHTLIFNGDDNSVIVDEETLSSGQNIVSTNNLLLAKRDSASNLNGKIYYVKITDKATGELVRNMIPSYRKSDNVIGMYDTVNGVFYTNQGTGAFDKGKDVNSIITYSTQVITNDDHTLYAFWQKN